MHLTRVRFLDPPKTDEQRREWESVVLSELAKMPTEGTDLARVLHLFWESVRAPQADVLPLPPIGRKRRRPLGEVLLCRSE